MERYWWYDSLDDQRQLLTEKLWHLIRDKENDLGFTVRIVDYVCSILPRKDREKLQKLLRDCRQYLNEFDTKYLYNLRRLDGPEVKGQERLNAEHGMSNFMRKWDKDKPKKHGGFKFGSPHDVRKEMERLEGIKNKSGKAKELLKEEIRILSGLMTQTNVEDVKAACNDAIKGVLIRQPPEDVKAFLCELRNLFTKVRHALKTNYIMKDDPRMVFVLRTSGARLITFKDLPYRLRKLAESQSPLYFINPDLDYDQALKIAADPLLDRLEQEGNKEDDRMQYEYRRLTEEPQFTIELLDLNINYVDYWVPRDSQDRQKQRVVARQEVENEECWRPEAGNFICPGCGYRTFDGVKCRRVHPLPPKDKRPTHFEYLGIKHKMPESDEVTDLAILKKSVQVERKIKRYYKRRGFHLTTKLDLKKRGLNDIGIKYWRAALEAELVSPEGIPLTEIPEIEKKTRSGRCGYKRKNKLGQQRADVLDTWEV
jgi:hypothetical protein